MYAGPEVIPDFDLTLENPTSAVFFIQRRSPRTPIRPEARDLLKQRWVSLKPQTLNSESETLSHAS